MSRPGLRWWRSGCRVATALGLASMIAAVAAAEPPGLDAELHRLVMIGEERPEAALAALAGLPAEAGLAGRRQWLARGLVQAGSGRGEEARRSAEAMLSLAPEGSTGEAALVRARLHENEGHNDRAAEAAALAIEHFDRRCAGQAETCLAGERWHARMLAQRAATARGALEQARQHAQHALAHAQAAADPVCRIRSELTLALAQARLGDVASAGHGLQAARRQAELHGDAALAARVFLFEAMLADMQGLAPEALRAVREGLAAVDASRAPRTAALLRINLVDLELKAGNPRTALAAAEMAVPVVRRFGDRRRERVLLHNMGLARLALGQIESGRRDLDAALMLWGTTGAERERAAVLREYADALARAGDLKGALEMHRRERQAQADAMERSREAALASLQAQFQRTEQEREIALKQRARELGDLALANEQLRLWIWGLVALGASLAAGVSVLLLRRLRRTQRQLAERQSKLRVQSERDALTGLANRRHLLARMSTQADSRPAFEGGLALIDIDHFKQINDSCGHAGGDSVLREVALRIAAVVRDGDLLARWGGEEFLVLLPSADEAGVRRLATRVLEAVGRQAVALGDGRHRAVTVSVGHACFPIGTSPTPMSWEQALNLVDMAMYLAKAEGRNQASGIETIDATDAATLQTIAEDFELAVRQGRVTLSHDAGPPQAVAAQRAPQAA